jgi:hypothetical protein
MKKSASISKNSPVRHAGLIGAPGAFVLIVLFLVGFLVSPTLAQAQSRTADTATINPDVSDILTVLGLKLQGWTDSRIGRVRFASSVGPLSDETGFRYADSRRTGAAILDLKQVSTEPPTYRIVINYRFDDQLGRRAFVMVSAVYSVSGNVIYVSSALATADTPDVGRLIVILARGGSDLSPAQLVERPFADILTVASATALSPAELANLPDQPADLRLYVFDMLRAPPESSIGVAFSGANVRQLAGVTASAASNINGFRVAVVDGNLNLGARPGFIFDVVSDSGKSKGKTVRLLRKFSSARLARVTP